MQFDPKTIRRMFLAVAIALLAVVIGFYSYARYRINRALKHVPEKLGIEVQQSTQGYTFTKSANGRKQFTISAGKAVQYKTGQRATLHDVRIIVYGRSVTSQTGQLQDTYDQMFGKEFDYDPQSGDVRANGVVHIDLERHGTPTDDPMQEHNERGSIHLITNGLVFNRNNGIAQTRETIEFSLPQANGSAKGAVYDSREMKLTLLADVRVRTTEGESNSKVNMNAADIRASRAVITDSPRKAELKDVAVTQGSRDLTSPLVRIYLRPDSTVDHVDASGGVIAHDRDPKNTNETRAREAVFTFASKNLLRDAVLTGDVSVQSSGSANLNGTAGRAEVTFGGANQVSGVRANGGVNFAQRDPKQPNQSTALQAEAINFIVRNNQITSATTEGASQITLSQQQNKTLVTADKFEAKFASANRLSVLRGAPNAKVVFPADKSAQQRVTTSDEAIAQFNTSQRGTQIQMVEQNGNFHYVEGARKASAEHAHYVPADETIVARGQPRFEDASVGLTLAAETLRLNRRTNSVQADTDVKTTYLGSQRNPNGALLASADPVHVTSAHATATPGKARFVGNARLWQGSSIIEAGEIDFDRQARTVEAKADPNRRVQVNFTQTGNDGKQVPITVTAAHLNYADGQRKATFTDGVQAVSSEVTMRAKQMDVLLHPHGQNGDQSGQLDQIIASGNVQLEQRNPVRKANGSKLVYTARNAKFVMTGSQEETASIFDAERGNIQADSLTFFSHDDTVQVGSGENTRVVTKTRIKEDSRP
jgi:lipopolysaccharide export system protein LptA